VTNHLFKHRLQDLLQHGSDNSGAPFPRDTGQARSGSFDAEIVAGVALVLRGLVHMVTTRAFREGHVGVVEIRLFRGRNLIHIFVAALTDRGGDRG